MKICTFATSDIKQPPVGDYLGELTNELKEGDWITEFSVMALKIMHTKRTKEKKYVKSKGFL